jgi:hypothetical protein
LKFFLNNRDEQLSGRGAPDLRIDCILAVAKYLLDAKVLINSFVKPFHLPVACVKSSYLPGRQWFVFGQAAQSMLFFGIFEWDTPQVFGIVLGDVVPLQFYGLIVDNVVCPVHFVRLQAPSVLVAFCFGCKEDSSLMNLKQVCKVHVAAAYDVESSSLLDQDVQNNGLVQISIDDLDEGRNRDSKVQQAAQVHCYLGFAKQRPVELTQAQIDCGSIQCVERVLEIESQVLVPIKFANSPNQNCNQVGPDSQIARLVGIVQGGAVAVAKSDCVWLARIGSKTHFTVLQALSQIQLRKNHNSELPRTSQAQHIRVVAKAHKDLGKSYQGNEPHNLRKQGIADIHRKPPRSLSPGNYSGMCKRVSNQHQIKLASRTHQYLHKLQINPV